jgi:hypothetical protein
MDPCGGEMVCPAPNIGWSALLLWTITVYGVLAILSLFVSAVHVREPSPTGARILRLLSVFDLAAAGIAPLVILFGLGAPRAAAVAVVGQLGLAALCRAAARRTTAARLPRARLVR